MEALKRKPFQGIANIIRFNWHFYVLALAAVCLLHLVKPYVPVLHPLIGIIAVLIIVTTFISLAVSFYVYDLSNLYSLDWLDVLSVPADAELVNINAGFDETSSLLANKYPAAHLTVFDFYDLQKHTEISIKRARKRYPPYPGTVTIQTSNVPLPSYAADVFFCILSAHEIRNHEERVQFFCQLKKGIKNGGSVVVVEHLRDFLNFMAYNIGAFHFHSGKDWKHTFKEAGLRLDRQATITPFITVYILRHGTAP